MPYQFAQEMLPFKRVILPINEFDMQKFSLPQRQNVHVHTYVLPVDPSLTLMLNMNKLTFILMI